jgi:hypothetical protein
MLFDLFPLMNIRSVLLVIVGSSVVLVVVLVQVLVLSE